MKNRIKKALVVGTLLVTMATSLIACGKKECDVCGEMGKCKTKEFFGQEINICEDCLDMFSY